MEKRIGWTFLILASQLSVAAIPANAQDDQSAETDPIIVALEKQKKIAELEKDIANAEKEARGAGLPDSDTKGSSGNVELGEGVGYYAELQAYETLGETAEEIVSEIKECKIGKMILMGQDDLSLKLQVWNLINTKLEWFKVEFTKLLDSTKDITGPDDLGGPESAIDLVSLLPSVLGGLADIASFFRTDASIKNREVTLAISALMAELAKNLITQGSANVFIPGLAFQGTGQLVQSFMDLGSQRRSVAERKEKLAKLMKPSLDSLNAKRRELVAKQSELAELKKQNPPDTGKVTAAENAIRGLESQIFTLGQAETEWNKLAGNFNALIAAFDQYQKAITEPSGEKAAPVDSLAIVDTLKAHTDACRLSVAIVSQGGEVHIAKNNWSSGRITYLGGSVVTYYLFDKNDKLIAAGAVPNWRGSSFKAKSGPVNKEPVSSSAN